MTPSPYQAWARSAVILVAAVLLTGCSENDAPDDEVNPARAQEIPRIVPASEALSGAHIATLDPAKLKGAEIREAIGAVPHCEFSYTSSSEPVLAVKASGGSDAGGVVKLNGKLVRLRAETADGRTELLADAVHLVLTPDGPPSAEPGERQQAQLIFEIEDRLRVGYRGYYRCLG